MSDGTYNYIYDADGNTLTRIKISDGSETDYSWDNRDHLVSVKDFTGTGSSQVQIRQVDYEYDMFGRLIGRTLTPNTSRTAGTPVASRFINDLPSPLAGEGSGVTGSGNMVLAFDGTKALTDRCLWGPAVDQILADEQFSPSSGATPSNPGTTYWTLTDNQATVRDLITYGSLYDHLDLDAFGRRWWRSNSSASGRVGYTGSYYAPATALVHDGVR